ncbi:MAG: transcription antitermination factor NusB [Dehalococcoidia bacterium]|nr:transcription antitermination factor NusB [Dehalococcoidia bacterium]
MHPRGWWHGDGVTDHVLRRARCLVIEALYEAETSGHDAEAAYDRRLQDVAGEDREVTGKRPSSFGREVLRGILDSRDDLDRRLQPVAPRHPLGTLPVVERTILRLALWELLHDNSAPVGAVVNEAVELAHRYGSETSAGFVNGVLRTVSKEISAARAQEPSEPASTPEET